MDRPAMPINPHSRYASLMAASVNNCYEEPDGPMCTDYVAAVHMSNYDIIVARGTPDSNGTAFVSMLN